MQVFFFWERWNQDGVWSYVKRSYHGHKEQIDMRTIDGSLVATTKSYDKKQNRKICHLEKN